MSSVVARKFQLLRDKRAKGKLRLYCGRGCFRQSLGPVTDTHVLSTCLNCLNISQFVCKQFIPLATSGSPLQPRALPGVTDSQSIVYNTGLTLQWHRSHQNFCSTYSVSLDVLFMCVCLGRISLMLLLFGRCYLVVIKPKAVNVSVWYASQCETCIVQILYI